MGQIAFVFAGQGAQYPRMGQSLCGVSSAARAVFAQADALRPGTGAQCFSGTAEELAITENTQPCVWCVDLAAARALEEAGVSPAFAAGFSLGEVAALTFAGAFSDADGFRFVTRRAQAMQRAAQQSPGSMAAILKLFNETVEALCSRFDRVWPVNYNCPGQVSVAGESGQLADLCALVAENGGRAVPLKVSGGFHSPLMESAARELEPFLNELPLGAPKIPVYANCTAQPYDGEAKATLLAQVVCPVRWQETVEALAAAGVDTFIECGPGKTLSGLIKKTVREARVYRVEDEATLRETLAALS